MRGISSYLAVFALLVAATHITAQRPAVKNDKDPNGLVYVAKGAGTFVKLANSKLQLKYKEGDKDKTIDLALAPQVVVRVKSPPVAFDSKGRLKQYTKAELDDLKGEDKKEWGFEANMNDLKSGQLIQVWLYRPRSNPKSDPLIGKIYIGD